ncbi:MAG: SGNH/GDSL hydrolase family protein [Clostridia bacterium]|nr:SGNH/GDSL hydrolase family protein [Clostridia bacterium]
MKLEGLTVNFLGDSITEGTGVINVAENRYDNRLKRMYNLGASNNYGIGGTRLAHQEKPSDKPRYDLCFCGRAYNMDPGADLIVVYGGVNDYIHGDAYFGKMEDRTPETFCGAVYFLMELIKTLYPGTPVVFMTPAHCHFRGVSDREVSPRPVKKPDAKPLAEYVRVIKERGEELGIPVLDLFENLGIDPNNEEEMTLYTEDGLHFNDYGHAYIARALGDFLTKL